MDHGLNSAMDHYGILNEIRICINQTIGIIKVIVSTTQSITII